MSKQKRDKKSSKESTEAELKKAKTEDTKPIPKHFYEEFALIKEMRKKHDAPVDSQGTECCGDRSAVPKVYRFQVLIGLLLSSQTKDGVTASAMDRLKEYGLTPEHMKDTSEEKLQELIKPVGFYKRKAVYIKKTSEILLNEYDGDIPSTIEELLKLPGIGPKMGYLCLNVAWDKNDGIGVDVHVDRICNRLKWVKSTTPEGTREQLQSWLPKEYWREINLLLVGFGQQICGSKPKCEVCKLKGLCPSCELKDIEDV